MNIRSGARVGPYEILAPLGAGGMGEVYRARDPRLGRDVAVKVLPASYSTDPDRLARFEREARAASRLDHPNILVIHDIGMHEGAPYVVSELLEGETLGNRLASGPIPVRKAVECALQIAQGLAAAHEKGIVHRDLKPANLFLTKDGRAKILDFGLAKLVQLEDASTLTHAHGTPAETEPGVVLGTIGYMAPEQVRGLPADHRSDLFAFGAVLYEMLSGRRAFQAQSVADIMSAILKEDPPALRAMNPNIPPAIELIVRHCLEKEPAQRFQNASDLAFNLEAASRGSAEPATAPSSSRPAGTSRRRARLVAFMILTVVAATSLALLAAMQVKLNELNGRPARVNYQRLTFQRGAVSAARFAPDGKTIYYTATWDGRPLDLFETQPGEVASQPMGLTRSHLLSISSTGTIALSMDDDQFIYTGASRLGTLGELPITGGAPHRILEDVRAADWSPDGKTLAVVHNVEGTDRLEMPPGNIIYRTAGWINALRISPSGQWLAFMEKTSPPNVRGKVVIMDAWGKIAAMSSEWRALEGLAWSADGEEVWFSAAGDNVCFDLRTLSPDGRERVVEQFPGWIALHDIGRDGRMLLSRVHVQWGMRGSRSPGDAEIDLGWLDGPHARDISSDGETLLFVEMGTGGGRLYSTCLRRMDGSPPVRIGEGHAQDLSPDGKHVLSIRFGPPHRLVILSTGAGDSTSLPRGSITRYLGARWLPDGNGVVFTGSEAAGPWRSYVQDVDGGLPRSITPEGVAATAISPDGRFVAGAMGQRLMIFPVDGGVPKPVGEVSRGESILQWSPDAESIYLEQPGPTLSVTRFDLETGQRTVWKIFTVPDPAGIWVRGPVFAGNGQAYAYNYMRWLDELYVVEGLE